MDNGELGGAVRALVGAWLAWDQEVARRERVAEMEDRVEGYRIVDGGQTSPDGSWEITDAASGELLAHGRGLESYNAAWQEGWAHIDSISDDAFGSTEQPVGDFGLPSGLRQVLADWVVDRPDEARAVMGA